MTNTTPWEYLFGNIPHLMHTRLLKLAKERGEDVGEQSFMQWLMSVQSNRRIRGVLSSNQIKMLKQILEDVGLRVQVGEKSPVFSHAEAKKQRVRRVFAALLSVDLGKSGVDPTLRKLIEDPELSKEWEGMVALLAKSPALKKLVDAHVEECEKSELPRIKVADIPIQEARDVQVDRAFLADLAKEVFGDEDTPTLDLVGVAKALNTLSVRSRDTVLLRLGAKWTYTRIGAAMRTDKKPEGVNASRARSTFIYAMLHLRHDNRARAMLGRERRTQAAKEFRDEN